MKRFKKAFILSLILILEMMHNFIGNPSENYVKAQENEIDSVSLNFSNHLVGLSNEEVKNLISSDNLNYEIYSVYFFDSNNDLFDMSKTNDNGFIHLRIVLKANDGLYFSFYDNSNDSTQKNNYIGTVNSNYNSLHGYIVTKSNTNLDVYKYAFPTPSKNEEAIYLILDFDINYVLCKDFYYVNSKEINLKVCNECGRQYANYKHKKSQIFWPIFILIISATSLALAFYIFKRRNNK